eukprot:44895_1
MALQKLNTNNQQDELKGLSPKESQELRLLEIKLANMDIILNNKINQILETTQKTDSEIENTFNTFRDKLNERQRLLRQELNDESNKQIHQLQQKQKHLERYINTIKNGLNQQNSLGLNASLDAIKQETQIRNIDNKIQPISLMLNTNKVNEYISSIGAIKVVKPQQVTLPRTQLRYAQFNDITKKIKLGFRLRYENQNKHIDIIEKCLKIHVSCRLDESDDDEKTADNLLVIHEENIPFKDCKCIGKTFELEVNKNFDAGTTVEFRIKPIFISFDDRKYVSSEGNFGRTMTYDIPEPDLTFNVDFENESKEINVACDEYENIRSFRNTFLNAFNKRLTLDEKLVLTTDGKQLSGSLTTYAVNLRPEKHELLVYGYIHELKFNDLNILNDVINIVLLYEDDKYVIKGEIVVQPMKARRQMSIITIFEGQKKRIVLKNRPERNQYEYTIDYLKEICIRKFRSRSLQEPFIIRIDTGKTIETDDDIVTHLMEYNGDVEIVKISNFSSV